MNENKNTTTKNLWDSVKAVLSEDELKSLLMKVKTRQPKTYGIQ